ncbi:MAG: response regulator transcription factor [Symploca sp. SIO2G7]|nr:response regulator transcription factor [Symploca sp. SIO2G7]
MDSIKKAAHKQWFLVVDDHEAVLQGTVPALKKAYPQAEILTAQDYRSAIQLVDQVQPELMVVDLSIPQRAGEIATPDVGLQLVEQLLTGELSPNIAVLSTDINPLVRLKAMIKGYEGGFAAMDKSLPLQEMLNYIDFAMRGSVYLPQKVKVRPEFHPKWLELLQLRFQEGLTDKAVAKRMGTSDRTIRNYWVRIQDALLIGDEPDKDLKVQIEIEARKIGLIH